MKTMKFTKEGRDWVLPDAFYRISIKVIIKNASDKLLVVQDKNDGMWEIPGGGLDHGETVLQTAEREIKEELGVDLLEIDPIPLAIEPGMHENGYATVMIYFKGKISGNDFMLEEKFVSKFVEREEFLKLKMASDESPIQKWADTIWDE